MGRERLRNGGGLFTMAGMVGTDSGISKADRRLKWICIVVGVMAVGAGPFAVMPRGWLVWLIDRAEPGSKVGFVISYLARLISAYYCVLGLLLVVFGRDVRRYRPALRVVGWWLAAAGPIMAVHVVSLVEPGSRGWFFYGMLSDCTFGFVCGLIILWLCQSGKAQEEQHVSD